MEVFETSPEDLNVDESRSFVVVITEENVGVMDEEMIVGVGIGADSVADSGTDVSTGVGGIDDDGDAVVVVVVDGVEVAAVAGSDPDEVVVDGGFFCSTICLGTHFPDVELGRSSV